MMRNAAIFAVVLAVGLVQSAPAQAERTWCVGGFQWASSSGTTVGADACSSAQKNYGLPSWHFHTFVTKDGNKCYACWDMSDNTCEEADAKSKGWRAVTPDDCRTMTPASMGEKKFHDPDNKWNPKDEQVVIVPFDDPPLPPPKPPAPPKPPDTAVVVVPPPPPPDPAIVLPPPPPPPDPAPFVPDPPPPPPKPGVVLTPVTIAVGIRVSPGPYAVNDPITMTGSATVNGQPRPVSGGTFQFFTPDGQPVLGPDQKPLVVAAKPGPKGTVIATAPAPVAGNLIIKYAPLGVEILSTEKKPGKPAPGEVKVDVAQCRLRGVVIAPTNGEVLAATSAFKLQLKGKFETSANAPSNDVRGANPVFAIEVEGKETRVPATAAGSEYTAEFEVQPPETEATDLSIRFFGDGGANDVCPGATSMAQLTKLGIALEAKALKNCYVDKPCPIEAQFKFPSDPNTRAAAEKFATAPDLKITLYRNGAEVGNLAVVTPGDPNTLLKGEWKPTGAGITDIEVKARSDAQGREVKDIVEQLKIKEPIMLNFPALLDIGAVRAGSDWPARCTILDFSHSRGFADESFKLKSTVPQGCESTPAVLSNGLGAPLPAGLEMTLNYDTRQVYICIAEVPRCAAENPAPVELTITPVNPDFADQEKKVQLKWSVTGRNFLACHWWWIAATLGGLALLFIGYGFVKPYSFAAHDAVKMASDRTKLARAVGRRLRELPGGRSGWYRNAATGLREDGSTTSKVKEAAVSLHAHKGDVYLKSRGGLQRVHPQSKKLEPLDTGKDGVSASKGVIYVVGDLHFTID